MGERRRGVDTRATMSPVAFPIVWAIGLLVFAAIVAARRGSCSPRGRPPRLDRIPERLRRAAVDGRRAAEVPVAASSRRGSCTR